MSTTHTHASRPGGSRRLVLGGAVSVAVISTVSAYLAMVGFGRDVLGMNAATAYTTAGVFELSLVTVALLAREAARDNRPGGTLLGLTWILSSASGVFAAIHEVYLDHPAGAVAFRFIVPLLAALMWHLALIGDRHLATGASWSGMRQAARMHALFLTTEDLFRAQGMHDGTYRARRRLARAEAARRRARAVALRTVPPEGMRAQVATWAEALRAVSDGTADVAELHTADLARMAAILDTPARLRLPATVALPDAYDEAVTAAVTAEVRHLTTGDTDSDTTGDSAGDTNGDVSSRRRVAASHDTARDNRRRVTSGVTRAKSARVTGDDERPARARMLRAEGVTVAEVAAELGVSTRTVMRWAPPTTTEDPTPAPASDTAPDDATTTPAPDVLAEVS